MNGINPFEQHKIIQILGESCSISDSDTLKKLRELSTSYNNILKTSYFNLLQVKMSVDMGYEELLYHFPSGSKCKVELKDWGPKIAERIRVLEFDVEYNEEYCDSTPSSLKAMDIYHVLFNQLFPHVTTLKLIGLQEPLNTVKLLNFIRQFVNLKNISLKIYKPEEQWLNDFKIVLSTLKSSGKIVELRLNYCRIDEIETEILAPEKGIINHS